MRKFALALLVGATLSLQGCGKIIADAVVEKVLERTEESSSSGPAEKEKPVVLTEDIPGKRFVCIEVRAGDKSSKDCSVMKMYLQASGNIIFKTDDEEGIYTKMSGKQYKYDNGDTVNIDINGDVMTVSGYTDDTFIIISLIAK